MEFKEYIDRVSELIWEDYDGYTYDLDSLDKQLAMPFANDVSIEHISEILLKRHKYIMHLVDGMNRGDKESHKELLNIINAHEVIEMSK